MSKIMQMTVPESVNREIIIGHEYEFSPRESICSCYVDDMELFLVSEITFFLLGDRANISQRHVVTETIRENNVSWVLSKWELALAGYKIKSKNKTLTNRQGLITIVSKITSTEEKTKWIDEKVIQVNLPKPEFHPRELNYEVLPIADLKVDDSYQRKTSKQKVRQIVRKFDIGVVGALIVSKRENGDYMVVDGSHRIEAMKMLNIDSIMCVVHTGLTVADEARLFTKCNNTRKQPSAIDNYKANLISGDSATIEITDIVESYGYKIDFKDQPYREKESEGKTIRAVSALLTTYKSIGAEGLKEVVSIFAKMGVKRPIHIDFTGMGIFIYRYKGQYDKEELLKKLESVSQTELVSKARQMVDVLGGHSTTNYAKYVAQIYNKGKSTRKLSVE